VGFLRRLFGGQAGGASPAGDDGFFVYVQCERCGAAVRLRIHKQHDLNRTDDGYSWHKTVVDSRCFRPMPTVAFFDGSYQMTGNEIQGGHYISREQYDELEAARAAGVQPPDRQQEDEPGDQP
jgi:hypothetical protein